MNSYSQQDLLERINRRRRWQPNQSGDGGTWEDPNDFIDRMQSSGSASPDVQNFQHMMVENEKDQNLANLRAVMGGRYRVPEGYKAPDAYLQYQNPHDPTKWQGYWDDEFGDRHYGMSPEEQAVTGGRAGMQQYERTQAIQGNPQRRMFQGDILSDYWRGRGAF